LAREVIIKGIVRAVWPIVKSVAHRPGFRDARHIWW
jgi:hypothetical protein